jgi:hypothetical protein
MINKLDKPLIQTNPYLRDPQERRSQFLTAVLTSTSVEGVNISPSELRSPAKKTAKRK